MHSCLYSLGVIEARYDRGNHVGSKPTDENAAVILIARSCVCMSVIVSNEISIFFIAFTCHSCPIAFTKPHDRIPHLDSQNDLSSSERILTRLHRQNHQHHRCRRRTLLIDIYVVHSRWSSLSRLLVNVLLPASEHVYDPPLCHFHRWWPPQRMMMLLLMLLLLMVMGRRRRTMREMMLFLSVALTAAQTFAFVWLLLPLYSTPLAAAAGSFSCLSVFVETMWSCCVLARRVWAALPDSCHSVMAVVLIDVLWVARQVFLHLAFAVYVVFSLIGCPKACLVVSPSTVPSFAGC